MLNKLFTFINCLKPKQSDKMGVEKIEAISIHCDECGEILESTDGFSVFMMESDIDLSHYGWKKVQEKILCDCCVEERNINQDLKGGTAKSIGRTALKVVAWCLVIHTAFRALKWLYGWI